MQTLRKANGLKRSSIKRKAPKRLVTARILKKGILRRKRPKIAASGLWTLGTADSAFSLFIRFRDKKCVRCGSTERRLTCSHFWGRTHNGTRFDPENCDALCWLPCHKEWEHEKQGGYRDFKVNQLGMARYQALEARARPVYPQRQAILACMREYASYTERVGN